jgi:hypothetical protein
LVLHRPRTSKHASFATARSASSERCIWPGGQKDFQRRLGFLANGQVDAQINQAIESALGSSLPGATSCFKTFKKIQDDLFAQKAADRDHMAFPDRGIDAVKPGDVPTLSCLSADIQQACLCVGSFDVEQGLMKAQWFARAAMSNVQFWSATKYLSSLCVACQANKKNPAVKIADCKIHRQGDLQVPADLCFDAFVLDVFSCRKGVARSNSIGLMFKRLCNPGKPDVQQWLSALTGSVGVQFLGGYGVDPSVGLAPLPLPSRTAARCPVATAA